MIKYLGSKRLLLPHLLETIGALDGVETVLDAFSGTSRVGHALKGAGYRVTANDHNAYAHVLARCYVQADGARVRARAAALLEELADTPPHDGPFTEMYCRQARYLQPDNGAQVEGIRDRIAELDLEPDLEAVVLTSLMEAADRVDSTTGVQMAYLKKWAPRSHNELQLRVPDVLDGPGEARRGEAIDAVRGRRFNLVYLDPPYNQHSYLGNYHVWETLVRWDHPETYGIARKRIDCRERRSPFNSKVKIYAALEAVVDAVDADHLLVSFNNEGHLDRATLESMLARRGPVSVREIDYQRYVGAKIGIHDPSGRKVGRVSHTRNVEYLFHVDLR